MMLQHSTMGSVNRPAFFWPLVIMYIILITSLLFLGILCYRNNEAFNDGVALISHERTIIEYTDSLMLLSQNLQWENRNYVLTGNPQTHQAYLAIRDSLQRNATYLIQFFNNNSALHANALKLKQQIAELIRFADSLVYMKQAAYALNFANNVRQHVLLNNAIGDNIKAIKLAESRLLDARRAAVFKTVDATRNIFKIAGILFVGLLTATFVFVFYHFSRRLKVEKKLIESEHRFQILINSTKDLCIYMIDKNGIITNWYEGAHKIKGYNSEEAIGKHISIFYTPEAIAAGDPELNLEAAAAQGSFKTEGWCVRKDGSLFWADTLITAVYDKDGKVQGFTKITRDFTLHKQVEDEVKNMLQKEKDLNEMKSNFVSMASHEFRTPLSTILSSVSLIEHYTTTETQDKRDKHTRRIKSAVTEMVSTLEEFLSLEKIEEGKISIKKEIINLKQLGEHVRTRFNTLLKPGQTIVYNHNGKAEVYLDAAFVNHILNNLLSNAVKYSPEHTQVIFEISASDNIVTLKVKDHGIGISSEDQQHLFERFFRASNTGSIKGTGLGLHIVKRYIDLMQGSISVESNIGQGSIFTIILPS